jgi:polyhydroxybutyrate depolymerase
MSLLPGSARVPTSEPAYVVLEMSTRLLMTSPKAGSTLPKEAFGLGNQDPSTEIRLGNEGITTMTVLLNQPLNNDPDRTYNVYVPDSPPATPVPAIIGFHGGGGHVEHMARLWGVDMAGSPPPQLEDYLLVFPEANRELGHRWVNLQADGGAFPTHDLLFLRDLLEDMGIGYANSAGNTITADADYVYAAGFSNGGAMVWQLMNSDLASRFRGFAAVARALDPVKAWHYRKELGGVPPTAAPAFYVHGTADPGFRPPVTLDETSFQNIDTTLPAFTVQEMLDRNLLPNGPATTTLVPGSTNTTEVIVQLWPPAGGNSEAFAYVTVVGGGHNWPSPMGAGRPDVASHFDTTRAIVKFWHNYAGLP